MITKGFYINSPGDPSVGIAAAEWKLTGPFDFDDEQHLNEFKQQLKIAFENVADDAGVETFEQRADRIKAEDKVWVDTQTQAIKQCNTFDELEQVIAQYAPFVSYSRAEPVYWHKENLMQRINAVRKGSEISLVTRACGLREKVTELMQKQICN